MRLRGTSRSAQPFVAVKQLPLVFDQGCSHRRCFLVHPPSCTPVPTDADADALEDYAVYAPLLLTPSPSSSSSSSSSRLAALLSPAAVHHFPAEALGVPVDVGKDTDNGWVEEELEREAYEEVPLSPLNRSEHELRSCWSSSESTLPSVHSTHAAKSPKTFVPARRYFPSRLLIMPSSSSRARTKIRPAVRPMGATTPRKKVPNGGKERLTVADWVSYPSSSPSSLAPHMPSIRIRTPTSPALYNTTQRSPRASSRASPPPFPHSPRPCPPGSALRLAPDPMRWYHSVVHPQMYGLCAAVARLLYEAGAGGYPPRLGTPSPCSPLPPSTPLSVGVVHECARAAVAFVSLLPRHLSLPVCALALPHLRTRSPGPAPPPDDGATCTEPSVLSALPTTRRPHAPTPPLPLCHCGASACRWCIRSASTRRCSASTHRRGAVAPPASAQRLCSPVVHAASPPRRNVRALSAHAQCPSVLHCPARVAPPTHNVVRQPMRCRASAGRVRHRGRRLCPHLHAPPPCTHSTSSRTQH
ncbi:hypothetical protein B0H10DRAFT_2209835 [Mycena sp. CBHHK59/15]|nr:hypothetical protein B0H10DRAFT_2209835 [Mycena sp. CBHHK59/15]